MSISGARNRSITVPAEHADAFRAAADLGHVRKTRTVICTVMGGRIPAVDATDEAFSDFLIVL